LGSLLILCFGRWCSDNTPCLYTGLSCLSVCPHERTLQHATTPHKVLPATHSSSSNFCH
jgi:hypothetical protein